MEYMKERLEAQILMFNALISNCGLQYIIDVFYQLVGNPIFVTDASGQFLARQTGVFEQDGSSYAQELYHDSVSEQLDARQLQVIQNWNLDEITKDGDGLYTFYNEGYGINCMVAATRVRGTVIAKMMMVEKHPFTEEIRALFLLLSEIIGQELQKDTFRIATENEPASDFLFHVLNTNKPNQRIIDKRLSLIHLKLKTQFQVAIVRSENGALSAIQVTNVFRRLQRILPSSIYTLYHNELVFLLQADEGQHLSAKTLERLERECAGNDLFIGISDEFTRISDIHVFYQQANHILKLRLRKQMMTAHRGRVCTFTDYAYLDLLNQASHQVELWRYNHHYLRWLQDYDRENHTEFMKTLYQFLQCNQNVKETAQKLYIHKNTLNYRLGKMRELLQDDLSDSETIFQLNLAFRILIFLDLFSPDTPE